MIDSPRWWEGNVIMSDGIRWRGRPEESVLTEYVVQKHFDALPAVAVAIEMHACNFFDVKTIWFDLAWNVIAQCELVKAIKMFEIKMGIRNKIS